MGFDWSPRHRAFKRLTRSLGTIGCLGPSLLSFGVIPATAQAQFAPYCQQSLDNISRKEALRTDAIKGNQDAEKTYQAMVLEQAKQLQLCRQQNQFRTQGIWLRLYECDTKPGRIEEVLDRIVDRGYNEVFVETFFNGMVLLPKADNSTAWDSVLLAKGQENRDLLAEIIRKGHERGLKINSWMFSLNFGYSYASRREKQSTLIRNGRGQTSIQTETSPGLSTELGSINPNEAFVDPYHPTARRDYLKMVQEVLKRKPDGMFFDYIRYPRLVGKHAIANEVSDLWVYGEASRSAMLSRANNEKGRELIRRYLDNHQITAEDVVDVDRRYPQEIAQPPLWQGRNPLPNENQLSPNDRRSRLADELWRFAVAHTYQGVVDFLALVSAPGQQNGITTGAVFFSDGNQTVGNGFDSRLQPWDRFPTNLEFHPMAYGNCGRADCIVNQVNRVLRMLPAGVKVKPVLAGIWQESVSNRPPLEVQMQAIKQAAPQITEMSHFAFSWQEPLSDRDRKFCRIPLPPLKVKLNRK
jgi:Glycosyl hydrolase-like 10